MLSIIAILVAPSLLASFDDDPGDVAYAAPKDVSFQDGDFDLRRFTVSADGDDVVFAVTLGARFRRPEITQRTQRTELQLLNDIYLQNIDIYVDTDRSRPGYTACIPGRRVAFPEGRSWKAAVVLTPQPGAARAVAEEAMGEAARHVVFAQGLATSGRTVTARVPAIVFGGAPTKAWSYSVHVSGASWERSFSVTDRLRGARELNAFTMPVVSFPEAYAFGGAPAGEQHPRVVDVLLPPGADQKAVLSSYTADSFARIPFVGEGPEAPKVSIALAPSAAPAQPKPPPAAGPELKVAYVAGNMISLSGTVPGLQPMQFGDVLGGDGATVARVVVVQIVDGGVVVSAVENKEKIVPGARVRFSPSRSPP